MSTTAKVAAEEPVTARDPFDADWRERLIVLGGLVAVLVAAYVIGIRYAAGSTKELSALVPASFFVVGKFLPLWSISGKSNFGPYELGLVIWVMDTCSVLIVVYALEGLYWIKPLKRWLDRIHDNARLVLVAYPRMRRTAVGGLVLFVLFPIAGTGALGAAFIGVLLGIHRGVLIAAVSLGGLLGGMSMAFLASNFASALRDFEALQRDPRLKYAFIALVVALFAAGVLWAGRAYRRALALADAQRAPDATAQPIDSA